MKRYLVAIILVTAILFGQTFHVNNSSGYLIGGEEDTIELRNLPLENIT